MSYPKVMKRSSQGHNKVKLDQNRWNSLFVLCSLRFYLLQTSMVVKTHLYPNIEIIPNTDYRGFMGVGGVSPLSNHPYASPAWYGTNLQNTRQIFHGDYEAQPKQVHIRRHALRLGFIWVLFRGHDKVIWRSHRGQNSSKWLKYLSFTFTFNYIHLGLSKMVENHLDLNTDTQHSGVASIS